MAADNPRVDFRRFSIRPVGGEQVDGLRCSHQHRENAFLAWLAMADLAEKTLDAPYYIWDSDTTSRILASRLLRAADRGVRVRTLIADHYQTGRKTL